MTMTLELSIWIAWAAIAINFGLIASNLRAHRRASKRLAEIDLLLLTARAMQPPRPFNPPAFLCGTPFLMEAIRKEEADRDKREGQ